MILLLSPEIYIHYFDNLPKVKKDDVTLDIASLLSNTNNIYVISRAIFNYIEQHYPEDYFEQVIGPFLNELLDNDNTTNVAGANTEDISEILDSMLLNNSRIKEPNVISATITMYQASAPKTTGAIVIEKIKKPSFEWVLFKVACRNPVSVTLRYSDFESNDQIQSVFDKFVEVSKVGNQPVIMDRQNNLQHNYFKKIKSGAVHYYTSYGNRNQSKFDEIVDSLPQARVYFGPSDQIHERKLIIGHFILETDEDFWNLDVGRTTWKIDFTYCSNIVENLRNKQSIHFRRHRPN